MKINSIVWQDSKVVIIDQTKLPLEEIYLEVTDYRELASAIKQLKIRGAPAIGVAGAFGVCLGANEIRTEDYSEFRKRIEVIIHDLAATRPTAVNLFWALEQMKKIIDSNIGIKPDEIKQKLLEEALRILNEDRETCRLMGEHGASLLKDGDTVLTHCNAGALATGGIGTALGVIFTVVKQGKKIKVYADETRPLLQGARLTTWELMKAGIDVTLICDNMAAWVMKQGWIDCVMVGADRIAANGDAANKIGTYNLAVLAQYHKIPFYVVAPTSTFDLTLKSGEEIPIEQRAAHEVSEGFGRRTTPKGVSIYNPAFDVTPNELIRAIITEKQICYHPFEFESSI